MKVARIREFLYRRKAYLALAAVFGLMMLFFLGSVPGRYKEPPKGDTNRVSETQQREGGRLKGSVVGGEREQGGVREGGKEDEGDVVYENNPFNKGNIALQQQLAEKSNKVEDKPLLDKEDLDRVDLDGEDLDRGDKPEDIKDLQEKIILYKIYHDKNEQDNDDEAPTANTTRSPSSVSVVQNLSPDDLYVHSSMPLGHTLSTVHTQRQQTIVQAFKHAWKGYKTLAWGYDELRPISMRGTSTDFGLGMTIVDSLDTMWLMGLQEEFDEARDWVATSMNIENNPHVVSLFETNIRVVGGLLSAYHLSQDRVFLEKAVQLVDRLLPAFNTSSGVPHSRINLKKGLSHTSKAKYGNSNAAEAGTLQLEFRDLSRATGDPRYKEKVDRNVDALLASSGGGLVPVTIQVSSGRFSGGVYTVGGAADSYYEYMLKEWLQSGKTEDKFLNYHKHTVQEITHHLVGYSQPSKMAFLGTKRALTSTLTPYMDHLACFYPGVLALGIHHGLYPDQQALAANLTHTCYHMYEVTQTGLAADSIGFNTNPSLPHDTVKKGGIAAKSMQRPETVEALFYLYRLTKDPKYRDWGWTIFQAFERSSKVDRGGYSELRDADSAVFGDKMESFFLSETLKYLFLLFGDDDSVVSLDEWVFNTEAHPLRVWRTDTSTHSK